MGRIVVVGTAVEAREQVGPLVMVPKLCIKGIEPRLLAAAHRFVDAQP